VIVSAHQPGYLPWLGFFEKIARSDAFCILDNAQFSRGDFINRNRIKSRQGAMWLTVPVHASGEHKPLICDVRIRDDGWRRKHVTAIEQCYRKAPFFDEYAAGICEMLGRPHEFLSQLNTELLRVLLRNLGITTPLILASDCDFGGKKSAYLLDMCVKLGATSYISGTRGREYLDEAAFSAAGISIVYQEYRHPRYAQCSQPFIPNLSVVDVLFNAGPLSLDLILNGSR